MENFEKGINLINYLIQECQSDSIKNEWSWGAQVLRNIDIQTLQNIKECLFRIEDLEK